MLSTYVLVTGANKGIGLATVRRILADRADCFVFLGARDPERGRAAVEAVVSAGGEPHTAESRRSRVEFVQLDVTSDASVGAAAAHIRSRVGARGLRGLVNNAGAYSDRLDAAGFCLETNFRGVKRVCDAFVPLLEPGCGRVVMVGSAAGAKFVGGCSPERQPAFLRADSSWEELEAIAEEYVAAQRSGSDPDAAIAAAGFPPRDFVNEYGLSKALLHSYTLQLAARGVWASACRPGLVATDLTRACEGTPAFFGGKRLSELGALSPEEATDGIVRLLFGEEAEPGGYFDAEGRRLPLDRL